MAYVINRTVSPAWGKGAKPCPHCKQKPDLQMSDSMLSSFESMVLGCHGRTDDCIRVQVADLSNARDGDLRRLYNVRFEMARTLVTKWNESHTEPTPDYLEGHA